MLFSEHLLFMLMKSVWEFDGDWRIAAASYIEIFNLKIWLMDL